MSPLSPSKWPSILLWLRNSPVHEGSNQAGQKYRDAEPWLSPVTHTHSLPRSELPRKSLTAASLSSASPNSTQSSDPNPCKDANSCASSKGSANGMTSIKGTTKKRCALLWKHLAKLGWSTDEVLALGDHGRGDARVGLAVCLPREVLVLEPRSQLESIIHKNK